MKIVIDRESPISGSHRVRQLESMFDVPTEEMSRVHWEGELPDFRSDDDWRIGLIVGPSGSGKSTIARELFGDEKSFQWGGASVIDDFDDDLSINDIAAVCQAVGFNTIPSWMRPFSVLSTGEQFRVDLARRMTAFYDGPILVDEFTSVVDRQVAKIGSYAVNKWINKHELRQFVAVSCHYDIIDWLQPDWIIEMPTMRLERRLVRRRPDIRVSVGRVPYSAWSIFSRFHYLTADLNKAAKCFCLFVEDDQGNQHPAAFAATLHRPHAKVDDIEGLSRLVTLPDWQGLGLAFVLSDMLGSAFAGLNKRFHTYPAHPALIHGYDRSSKYSLEKRPGHYSPRKGGTTSISGKFGGRPCAVFSYQGEKMDAELARGLVYGKTV